MMKATNRSNPSSTHSENRGFQVFDGSPFRLCLPFEPAEKQALLEAPTVADRCEALTALLEIDSLEADDDGPQSIQ